MDIRAHHLVCMRYFKGKGYSKEFISNFYKVINKLKNNQTIRIVNHPDIICSGANEDELALRTDIREFGVFGQKTVAGVNRIRICDLGCGKNALDVEVAVRGGPAADAYFLVCETHVKAVAVSLAVNRNCIDTQFFAGPDYPQSDLAPVGDEHFFKPCHL